MNSIIDYLEHWAAQQPDKCLSSFLGTDGNERENYTYLGFHERISYLAEYFSGQVGLRRGDRALLVYPPGLEVIAAFFACARAGVIPVPVYPPTPMRFEGGLAKLSFITRDCQARTALTTRRFYQSYLLHLDKRRISSPWQCAPALPKLEWFTTDDLRGRASDGLRNDPDPILFLQYTSGSTSDPKGVIVSHENVIHNALSTIDHVPTGVSWLPQYHDMGLIGYYLFPVVTGGTTYGFTFLDFLKRPLLWLQTISRVRATYASSPNFGFEYCLREDKVPSEELVGLDLSSLCVLMNASEPVRTNTYLRFLERFAPYGLRPQAHVAAYGLAENTLAVTNYGRRVVTINKRALQQGRLHVETARSRQKNQLRLVSCGAPLDGIQVRIVNPESRAALSEKQIGEIWVAGRSACQGYWKRPVLTQEVFGNAIANDLADRNAYIRTGDLGFFDDGELFVCGRIKEVIIIRGINYFPQDIEDIVESTSTRIRTGGVAAFAVDDEGETLVVVAEVRNPNDLPDPEEIARSIRTQYYVEPRTIIFVPSGTIAKTTSGKIARSLTRRRWLSGDLPAIAIHHRVKDRDSATDLSGLRERFRYLIETYDLTGQEEYTFAEMGIDSLTLVMLLEDFNQLMKEHGVSELAEEMDLRLLQRLTVADFFSLLDQLENLSAGLPLTLRYLLKRVGQEHESFELDCMRSDAELGPLKRVDVSARDEPLANILLTGATGFFGPFLLHSLLRQTPYTYYALVRATNPIHGIERIRASLHRARVWTPALNEALEKRVRVVCGDVASHNLGLRSDEWNALASRVDAVFHNAALVNYILNYDVLRPHNVEGTRELLRFSFNGIKKEFHFVSSTFIFGWTTHGNLLESDNNDEMANLDFGYAQSKWVAEQLVFAAERQGLKVRVYRPSLISASSTGGGSRDDIAIRLLAFMINHGVAVNAGNQISFLPADIAADNIAAIFRQQHTTGRTLHVTADGYYSMMDITRLIARDYGYSFTYYDIPTFVAEMNRRCGKDDLLYPLLDFFNRSHLKIAAMQHKRYSNDRYREARAQSDNGRADPPLRDTVSYLMAYMRREGLIEASDRARAPEPIVCLVEGVRRPRGRSRKTPRR